MAHAAQSPPTVRRFTRSEYHRMADAGVFVGERVELLGGQVVTMSPQSSDHASTVHWILLVLQRALGSTVVIRIQAPIVLDDGSEPEPDIVVCQPRSDLYRRSHPRPDEILLVIEVSESSLGYDRNEKARAYAKAGIPAYWIVNLVDDVVEVLTQPDPASGTYQRRETKAGAEQLALPGGTLVTVAELLPPSSP